MDQQQPPFEQTQTLEHDERPAAGGQVTRFVYCSLGVGAILCGIIYFSPYLFIHEQAAPPMQRLKTGGTSVVSVILQNRWKTAFRDTKGIDVDYESTGSTRGITKLLDHEYAIAFTHAPLTDEQRQAARSKGGELLQLPVLLCGVAPIYNLKELKAKAPLNFTGAVLAEIFLGRIKTWDNPALQARTRAPSCRKRR